MKLEMICTGEEILAGQIVDTNAAWLGERLMEQGIEMQRRVTVGDRLEDLVSVFQERSLCADVILVNGGLGPTEDDMSAFAMAQAKSEPLVECVTWRERLEHWYASQGRIMPASNSKQALLPASAVMVDNPVGTACGFRVKLNKAWLFFTPGVPHEFKQMVDEQFIPFVISEYSVTEKTLLHKLLTFGVGESSLADDLDKLVIPEGITIGYRSTMPHIEIKIFARGEEAANALPDTVDKVKVVLGDSLVSDGHSSLAAEVNQRLREQRISLSIAESCTMGQMASELLAQPGSDEYFHQAVTVTNDASKNKLLNISPKTSNKYGAASVELAVAMASNLRLLLESDYVLATSDMVALEVDGRQRTMVSIALVSQDKTWHQTIDIPFRRPEMFRSICAAVAYDMLRRALLGAPPIVAYPFIRRC